MIIASAKTASVTVLEIRSGTSYSAIVGALQQQAAG